MNRPTLRTRSVFRTMALSACIVAAAPLTAQIVTIDFDQHAIPAGVDAVIPSPRTEDGLTMQAPAGFLLLGQNHPSFTGVKAFSPAPQSNGQTVQTQIHSSRRFTVRSATLHPYTAGQSVTVNFLGTYGGVSNPQGHTTGTALSGTTVTFNNGFDSITNFSWNMTSSGGVYTNRHQISRIVIEFDAEVTTRPMLTVAEAGGPARVPLYLSAPRSLNTIINWEVTAGSAATGSDFTLPGGFSTGNVTIPAGATSTFLEVPLVNDTAVENPETFTVTYTGAIPGNGLNFPGNAASISSVVTIGSEDGVASFPGWMAAHGLTSGAAAADADPNGDGASNIESWLLRLNPAGPNPASWLSRRASLAGVPSDPGLQLVLPTPLPSDVRIVFSQSDGLNAWTEQTRRTGFGVGSSWTGSGASRVIETNNLSTRTVTLRASSSPSPRPRIFFMTTFSYEPGGISD